MSIFINPYAIVPGGLAELPASAPSGGPPIPDNPRQRVAFARDLSIGVFVECAWLADFARLAVRRHRRLRDALTLLGPAGFAPFNPVQQLSLFASTTEPRRDAIRWAGTVVAELISSLASSYDACSAGVLMIGQNSEANAHAAAFGLARRVVKVYDRHADELHPVAGWNPEDFPPPFYCPPVTKTEMPNYSIVRVPMPFRAYSVRAVEQRRLTRLWHRKARRFRGRLLDVVGGDYDREHRKWVALLEVEAGKVLAGLPSEHSPRTYLEGQIIATLATKGQRLTGAKLLTAMKLNPDNGSHRTMLAAMVERNEINNRKGGYGLPGWK